MVMQFMGDIIWMDKPKMASAPIYAMMGVTRSYCMKLVSMIRLWRMPRVMQKSILYQNALLFYSGTSVNDTRRDIIEGLLKIVSN